MSKLSGSWIDTADAANIVNIIAVSFNQPIDLKKLGNFLLYLIRKNIIAGIKNIVLAVALIGKNKW